MSRYVAAIHDQIGNFKAARAAAKSPPADSIPRGKLHDLTIQFQNAQGLPEMDLRGGSDPYIRADIDGQIKFVSAVVASSTSPEWNELFYVKNVPEEAILKIRVYDSDVDQSIDDFIGKCETPLVPAGEKSLKLESVTKKNRGTLNLNVIANPASNTKMPLYTFDGPVSYSRHLSPTVGSLTHNTTEERRYSTWKLRLKGVKAFFGNDWQHWNKDYKAAQKIFQGPLSIGVRTITRAAHDLLYARTSMNAFGTVNSASEFWDLFESPEHNTRIKPTNYTYVVNDEGIRFSETGAAFFVDFASKHALHSKCAESVRYSGEFHPRPVGGWTNWDDSKSHEEIGMELWIDNNSGTYAPDKTKLPELKSLLEYNFVGLKVVTHDREDPELKQSVQEMAAYAEAHRKPGLSPSPSFSDNNNQPSAEPPTTAPSQAAGSNAGATLSPDGSGKLKEKESLFRMATRKQKRLAKEGIEGVVQDAAH